MKINRDLLLHQLEKFVEFHEITTSKVIRSNEILYTLPTFSDDGSEFFIITICFSGNEVIGAISSPMQFEYFARHMADDDFTFDYRYIYPICNKDTVWNDIEFPILHLLARANDIYNGMEELPY